MFGLFFVFLSNSMTWLDPCQNKRWLQHDKQDNTLWLFDVAVKISIFIGKSSCLSLNWMGYQP